MWGRSTEAPKVPAKEGAPLPATGATGTVAPEVVFRPADRDTAADLEKLKEGLRAELLVEVKALFVQRDAEIKQNFSLLETALRKDLAAQIEAINLKQQRHESTQAKALEDTRQWTLAALGLTSSDGEVAAYTLKIRSELEEARRLVSTAKEQLPVPPPPKAEVVQRVQPEQAAPALEHRKQLEEDLKQAMDKMQAWMQEEMQALRLEMEMACVKAGYLAVAATECEYDEKTQLFSRLQDKEKALKDSSAKLATRPSNVSVVEIDRSSGKPLGIRSSTADPTILVVSEVQPGLIAEWNAGQPEDRKVRPGDRILAINDVHGDARKLTEAAAARGLLRITFQRSEATSSAIHV